MENSGKSESISDRSGSNGISVKGLSEDVKDWAHRKTDVGAPESWCHLSLRVRAPKLVRNFLPVNYSHLFISVYGSGFCVCSDCIFFRCVTFYLKNKMTQWL